MSETFLAEMTLSKTGFLFDHSTGLTYSLNPTGRFIFARMQEGTSAADILPALIEEFEIDETTARKDLDDFYRQLREMGLIAK